MIRIKASGSIQVRIYEDKDKLAIVDGTGQVAIVAKNEIDGLVQALLTAKVIKFFGRPFFLNDNLDLEECPVELVELAERIAGIAERPGLVIFDEDETSEEKEE